MRSELKSAGAPISAMLTVLLILLGAYIVGYFWLGDHYPSDEGSVRLYRTPWQQKLFVLGAAVESIVRRSNVQTGIVTKDGVIILGSDLP